jgi:transcription elongation factor GreA
MAKDLDVAELERELVEEIEKQDVEPGELLSTLTRTCRRARPGSAESLCRTAINAATEHLGNSQGMTLAQGVAPLLPKSNMIREVLAELYTAIHADREDLPGILAATVNDSKVPLDAAVEQVEALLVLAPGSFFRESIGRVTGQCIGVIDGVFHARFKDGEREYLLGRVPGLIPLPDDDFRSMCAFEQESLREFAVKDPCGFIEACVRAVGPRLTYRDLRSHILDVVPSPWSAWWSEARPLVKRSEWVEMSGTAQPTFELRKKPLSHEERVQAEFDEAETSFDQLLVILDYLAEAGDLVADEADLLFYMGAGISFLAGEDEALDLGVAAVMRTIELAIPGNLEGLEVPDLPEGGDPARILSTLGDGRLQRAVLDLVRERDPDGFADFGTAALPALSPELAESVLRELEAAGRRDDILALMSWVIENPSRFPSAFIWIFKEAAAGRYTPEEGGPDHSRLIGLMLLAIDRTLRGGPEDKKLSVRIRSAISARNFAVAREILSEMDLESARTVKGCLDRCFTISDDFRAKVADLLVETNHQLYASNLEVWELTDIIFTTAEGLEKKRDELDDLVMNVLPHIAEQIGKAAAEGDLSENAEYHGWLEQRARQSERANGMQTDLKIARVIQPEMAGTVAVSIGSRVTARDQTSGETKNFTFLGPWDADVEAGIFSYRAPLSLSFMGKKPGEVAVFDFDGETRRFEIVSICSAVESTEADTFLPTL